MLAVAVTLHFFIMRTLTYVGVEQPGHIFLNVSRFYMAVVMVAHMAVVMLTAMRNMFPNKRLNTGMYAFSAIVFIAAFIAIRAQTFVGDTRLSRSMIPASFDRHQEL
ncbi:MAG TPA: hypothetical protein PLC21_07490 [Deltaproteobacteria bacterium]|nr:hypothetical protein [Deltaproteobacteria bacterium]